MSFNITPSLLQDYIDSNEYRLRTGCAPGGLEEVIFRYGGFVGSRIDWFPSLDRSMDYCRALIKRKEQQNRSVHSGTIVVAEKLVHSKGRFARSWHAPVGGLWGCLIVANTFVDTTLNYIPLALGVTGCEAIREFGCHDASIRWINDVLMGGRKCGGFLVEGYRTSPGGEDYLLIGFGINLNNDIFPPQLGDMAISLKQATGKMIDYNQFCLSFFAKLCWNIGLVCYEEQQKLISGCYSGYGGSHLLIEQWKRLSDSLDRRVLYGYDVEKSPQYRAQVTDISNDGGLVMLLDDGEEITEHSGEIRYLS